VLLDTYIPTKKVHRPRAVHLIVDGTYFGERTEDTSWCVVVGRDQETGENLWWSFCHTETWTVYRTMRDELEELGYILLSVTGDGFGAIKQAFVRIPYQMCHVHVERLILKGTTRRPKLEAGAVLLALVRTLKYSTLNDIALFLIRKASIQRPDETDGLTNHYEKLFVL
jgi:hypothetical protein